MIKIIEVSILVLLDFRFGLSWHNLGVSFLIAVSILVLLDFRFGQRLRQSGFWFLLRFNPCFAGFPFRTAIFSGAILCFEAFYQGIFNDVYCCLLFISPFITIRLSMFVLLNFPRVLIFLRLWADFSIATV